MIGLEGIARNTSTLFELCIRNYSQVVSDLQGKRGQQTIAPDGSLRLMCTEQGHEAEHCH